MEVTVFRVLELLIFFLNIMVLMTVQKHVTSCYDFCAVLCVVVLRVSP